MHASFRAKRPIRSFICFALLLAGYVALPAQIQALGPDDMHAASRPDICDPLSLGSPSAFFAGYKDDRYDNSFLDLPGKSIFKDKPSQFRCGAFALRDGSGSGMYSTDTVLFVTDAAEGSVRVVRLTSGSQDQFDQLVRSLESRLGPGTILRTNVETGSEGGKRGEEISVLTSGPYRLYVDSVYMPGGRVGAVVVIRSDDRIAQAAMAAHPAE